VRALEAAATIGPYFAWDDLPGPTADWRPFAELHDPVVLSGRVAVARKAMATEERVAASIWSLGVFSTSVRVTDCSRRSPVTHASRPASARRSGSTLRMPQHSLRASMLCLNEK
jgi:hypothetical protein